MDIQLPLNPALAGIAKTDGSSLNLKLNQVLEARVVDTQIMLDTLSLAINGKSVTAQISPALNLQVGQSLQVLVSKLLPSPELTILAAAKTPDGNQASVNLEGQSLKLLVAPQSNNRPLDIVWTQTMRGQPMQATVLKLADNKITFQLQSLPTGLARQISPSDLSSPEKLLLTLDRRQITLNTPQTAASLAQQATPFNLKVGTQINLQLLKTGSSPVFVITPALAESKQAIFEAYKQLLPVQASPVPLLNQLRQVLPQLQTEASIGETLKNLALEILRSIPAKTQLAEPGQLKQVIAESGLFMETKLAALLAGNPESSLQDDFKVRLSKLVHLFQQVLNNHEQNQETSETLKESLQKAQSALAKLSLDQLASLPKEDALKQTWVLELPVYHNRITDSVKLEIEQDKTRDPEQEQQTWAVSITITPPDLATIHCKISCYGGSVNTRFWSEAIDTVAKINAHLDYLKQQLEKKGITIGFMDAHQGKPAQANRINTQVSNLLNEKA